MKINKLTINNLGPYVGDNVFDLRTTKKKNIILFGGKNGAGKTSLFTAIKLCLYGCRSMGYDNKSSKYSKEVIKFINDNVKYSENYSGYVKLDIDISNGHEIDKYMLCRKWIYNKNLNEEIEVTKNNEQLNDEAIYDFEKYILSIIPPDVFDLYFFDGEKIVDYFLESDGNKNLKSAIMCISGFTIFNIMRENFERIQNKDDKANNNYLEYKEYKKEYEYLLEVKNEINKTINELTAENKDVDYKLREITKKYKSLGGIDRNEWNEILLQIQKEEEKRSENNSLLKREANDALPFLLVNGLVDIIEKQIEKEESYRQYNSFISIFETIINTHKYNIEKNEITKIISDAKNDFGNKVDSIYSLSINENREVVACIKDLKKKDIAIFEKLIKDNQDSLKVTTELKQRLENCSNESINKYITQKDKLIELKEALLNEINNANNELTKIEKEIDIKGKEYFAKKEIVENEIKGSSINDISVKSILMIDSLEKELYEGQIEQIKEEFAKNIHSLMRKTDFINDIDIDEEFKITAYKNEQLNREEVVGILINSDNNIYINKLLNHFNKKSKEKCIEYLNGLKGKVNIPAIVDFTKISNGEKQVFIMALYQSIISLSKTQVPFIIDTPFARTDTEHREKISKNFFPNLNGQVIILSTNEEISKKYQKLMEDNIAKTYLLTNEGKSTSVIEDKYF